MAKGDVDAVLSYARAQVGKPYVWAAAGPNSFDCSGLTMQAYAQIDVVLAHFTGAQYAQLAHRPLSSAMPGDLIFYRDGVDIYHVAIKSGDNSMIHAANTELGVVETDIWTKDIMSTVGILPGNESGDDMASDDSSSGAVSGAPYTPEGAEALPRPLSASAKAKMITWLILQASLGRIQNLDAGGLQNASDDDLVKFYSGAYIAIDSKPSNNPLSDTGDALKAVANFLGKLGDADTWVRVAQVGGGAIIIGVALAAMLRTEVIKTASKGIGGALSSTGKTAAAPVKLKPIAGGTTSVGKARPRARQYSTGHIQGASFR